MQSLNTIDLLNATCSQLVPPLGVLRRPPETLAVAEAAGEIPGGLVATYKDPGGSTIYVMDRATDSATVGPDRW